MDHEAADRVARQWQRRRSAFNHDWLKNRFMPALAKLMHVLSGQILDPEFEQSFVDSVLPEWPERSGEVNALLCDFETEMSPRTMLERGPLSRCNPETKEWLGELIHQLWRRRHRVGELIHNGSTALRAADVAYQMLQQRIRDSAGGTTIQSCYDDLVLFRERCQDLATAIEAFPRRVLVT